MKFSIHFVLSSKMADKMADNNIVKDFQKGKPQGT